MKSYATPAIRNVVLLSHTGTGKSSLAEAMLFTSGGVSRLGRVEDGNTVTDYEPEEVKRRSSIQISIVPCEWKEHKVNLISTPGYLEYAGEVLAALTAADSAVLLVDAAVGVEVGTELRWRDLEERALPRFIFVNKMDRENADFVRAVASVQERLGRKCVPMQMTMGSQAGFQGVVDLLDANAKIPAGMEKHAQTWREQFMETAAEADDELTLLYLDKGELPPEALLKGVRLGIAQGSLVPILAGSALQNKGITELLNSAVQFLPSPLQRPPAQATLAGNKEKQPLPVDAQKPLAALVFKTTADPYVGKLSYFRVLSGTLNSDSQVFNSSTGQTERVGQVYVPRGKTQESVPHVVAGDIGAVAKLAGTSTGNTLATREKSWTIPWITMPMPVASVAVSPKTKADMDKMASALARILEEDPSLQYRRDQDTGETILAGLGSSHLDVALEKVKRKFGVDLVAQAPKVAYRETITAKTVVEYRHKKQSGGHGQFGHVVLEMEPLPRGTGNEFAVRVVGGSVPREYIPGVEKGVMEALQEGVLGKFRVVDTRVTLVDGSSHSVDSSNMAFQIAGSHGVKKGLEEARSVILEPIYFVKVTVPDPCTGDVVGDLNSKRAKVIGMVPEDGLTTIEAEAPLAEMQRYATDLRSLTQGRGYYTMEFTRYEPVPPHLQQRAIQEQNQKQHA
ncbi:MAG: elongation factor G [Chloroflexi bacterium]|nr:elongation factor G [Chloroflexota bacterium]